MNKDKMYNLICQEWEESERGWGTRPDGCSLHIDDNKLKEYIKNYQNSLPDAVPDEYERPVGSPETVTVSKELFDKVAKTKLGLRLFRSGYAIETVKFLKVK